MEKNAKNTSVWIGTTPQTNYPSLKEDIVVDAVVVGGGITGLSCALLLKEKGLKVALFEKGKIVEKTTGNTTAKVTSLNSLIYAKLLKKFSEEGAKMYGEANEAAISKIEELVNKYHITCDFLRTSAYTYAENEKDTKQVQEEAQAAKSLGLPAEFTENVPLPYQTYGAVKFTNQAQFHVRKYLLALAEVVHSDCSCVFEQTTVQDIQKDGNKYKVITDKGTITSEYVVQASHRPFYDPEGQYKDLSAFRDYALGVLIEEPTPQGLFYSTGQDPYSIRYQPTDEEDIIIVGGEGTDEAKAGNSEDAYKKLEEKYSKKFTIKDVKYKWYTFDMGTNNGVPNIGRLSKNMGNIYVATGFGGWGMTNGTAAGMIISDLITQDNNQWSGFFDVFTRDSYRIK